MPRSCHPACLLLLTALVPVGPAVAAPDPLAGRWCLTEVGTIAGTRTRAIGREWLFERGGILRVQSEANAAVRMDVRYRLRDERLIVPDLDLRLDIERRSGRRMTALGRDGELRYRFRRGPCRDADREAADEAREPGRGDRRDRGAGGDRGEPAGGLP